MFTLFTLSILCLISIPILFLVMTLLSIPFMIVMSLLPWLLRLAAVVLLIRAAFDRPFHLSSLLPALGFLLVAAILR